MFPDFLLFYEKVINSIARHVRICKAARSLKLYSHQSARLKFVLFTKATTVLFSIAIFFVIILRVVSCGMAH